MGFGESFYSFHYIGTGAYANAFDNRIENI